MIIGKFLNESLDLVHIFIVRSVMRTLSTVPVNSYTQSFGIIVGDCCITVLKHGARSYLLKHFQLYKYGTKANDKSIFIFPGCIIRLNVQYTW